MQVTNINHTHVVGVAKLSFRASFMGNTSSNSDGGAKRSAGGGGGLTHRSGSVEEHVEHAKRTGVCVLQEKNLSRLPERLQAVKETLRTLNLCNNKLASLPSWMDSFQHLKTLSVANNKLVDLPDELGFLKKLESLDLSSNALADVPDSLVNLKLLKTVNLSGNKLKEFPLFLCQLVHVNFVNLSSNQIAQIPEGIEVISAVEINLNQNRITALPDSLARCKRLKVLRVEENCIPLEGVSLAVLRNSIISLLCLEGNVVLSRELKQLPEYDKYMERFTASRRKQD